MAKITAGDVRTEMMLTGLDNGYVFEAGPASEMLCLTDGRFHFAFSEGMIAIGFHDANGDESYIVVPAEFPLDVSYD